MSGAALEIEAVGMRFGGFSALVDVSATIAPGTSTAVIGPNGAGKTTLLNCVCGTYRPTAGTIRWAGERIHGLRPHRIAARGVARTFQGVEQFRAMTAAELALMGRHQRFRSRMVEAALRLPRSGAEEREHLTAVEAMLARLGIGEVASRRLETLPYAVRKLADLARALCSQPRLLLLDEPSAGMGPGEKAFLHEVLRGLRGECFETLVVVDHDIQFIQGLCEQTVVLDFGREIAHGRTAGVLEQRQVVEAYLGVPVPRQDG
jgi:branched-chain amino acid transport system ATP-binding protein